MFKNPSFLFDILCTVVWLVLMVRYARKGFLASIVQLSGNLISLLGARQLTVLGLVNKLPVIGTVNRGLGWLTGGMTAMLDLYLVLCVVWGLVVITGGNLNVLNDTVMHSSLYYKAFNMFNPFL